ncbi:endopeptidase [Listeria booriae]|uniref:bifunctional lytic transglycosylase/C40 family peptidase n=1 Tax=Listeria booriae TaxID=1552123 RepID=UPI001626BC1D|nr:bifunctional lytic transglycosylase/C40 family peptidase [Listeria booriae]MBC1899057.1 endopeptidase [Listeria booriae]
MIPAAKIKIGIKIGKIVLWFVVGILLIIILAIAYEESENEQNPGGGDATSYGEGNIPSEVAIWKPIMLEELKKYGLEQYIYVVMAITTQESGGTASLDIMQSSESIGLPPNTIADPVYSIQIGVQHFKNVIDKMNKFGVDIDTAIQSYNYGSGYIDYIAKNGKKHTPALAQQFSNIQAGKLGWTSYGDPSYVDHVKRYMGAAQGGTGGSTVATGKFKVLMDDMLKYKGLPYFFGGASPPTFDCSGILQYCFSKTLNIQLPRTAQEQYNMSTKVPPDQLKPGDLVFFTGTYNAGRAVTHVGIYTGNGMMYNSNGSGVEYSTIQSGYWKDHLYGYGRVAAF